MRFSNALATIAVVAVAVCCMCMVVNAQAPNPPPIWPVSFHARFGLDDSPLLHAPIVNDTSYFYYNLNPGVGAQLIDYPDHCPLPPSVLNGIDYGCQLLFNTDGIYVTQPDAGIKCCLLFADVGPTPRNFTHGFTWQGVQNATDYFGTVRTSDYYTGGPSIAEFKYWTELHTHHDVYFHDGAGANWAWDHLNVTTVDPSVFDLFADADTCNTACGVPHFGVDTKQVQAHAAKHGFIALALHHHELKQQQQEDEDAEDDSENVDESMLDGVTMLL